MPGDTTRTVSLERPDMSPDAAGARFAANLAAFADRHPRLHARLSHIEATATALVGTADGGIDLAFGEGRLYGGDAAAFTLRQLARFLQDPERLSVSLANPGESGSISGTYARWALSHAASCGIEVPERRLGSSSHFTVVFGLGLGLHLNTLAEATACRELIVVEPNLEHLYHSLFTIDWAALLAEPGRRTVRFVIERDQDTIATRIREIVRAAGVALLDGTHVYLHHESALLATAHDTFRRDLPLHLYGLGFFEDEVQMMANTIANIGRGSARVIATALPPRDTPVIVCGSGPSIDADLPFIRDNREKALVVSLGSSLRILRAAGIVPDYHVELENDEANADNVDRVVEEFGVEGITLIAATPVRPRLAAHFGETIWYFRGQVAPSMVFAAGIDPLGACGPSVANAAQMALLYLGFRNLYLFGVDMGTRDREVYHSAATYIGLGKSREWGRGRRLPVPANFGGTAWAEGLLNWSRFTFANVARLHPDLNCVNCSDGVRIAHTTPMLPHRIPLPAAPIDRAAVRRHVGEALPDITGEACRRQWRRPQLEADARVCFDAIDALLAEAAATGGENPEWMGELYATTLHAAGPGAPTRVFLFGTTVMLLATFWWMDGRIGEADARAAFRRAAIARLREIYARLDARYTRLLDDVDGFFAGATDTIAANNREAA